MNSQRLFFFFVFAAGMLPASMTAQEVTPSADSAYRREVARLAEQPGVRRAFQVIEELEDSTVSQNIELSEIPAPPFREETRARRYADMLRQAGADTVWIDTEGNAVGVRRGTKGDSTLVISGHLDTVFPEGTDVSVTLRGDTLFGPGVGDDARGLMVTLTVLRAMERAGLRTRWDVWFVGTVGEEGLGDLRGVKHLFQEGAPSIHAFLSVDGGGDRRVVHRALGSRRYRVTVRGPGGHSWGDFGDPNPALALARIMTRFDQAAGDFTSQGPRTSYSVGRLGGGTSVNSIPFEVWMEVDMRSIDHPRLLEIDSLFNAVVPAAVAEQNELRRSGEPLTVEVELVGDRPSGVIELSAPLIQRALAVVEHFGWEPELGISSTDANVPISLGVPAATVGRGGVGEGTHSLDEWWLNQDGHLAIQRTLLLVLAQAGLAEGG
ncbi:MAG: M20/M25/M40 family metallo-hydrolase [Longimicrobiaceae bacterium]